MLCSTPPTPRADRNGNGLETANPFDHSPLATPTNHQFHHHHLLNPSSYFQHVAQPRTSPTTALPTTHLSLHPPVFKMQQPPRPSSLKRSLANAPSAPPQTQQSNSQNPSSPLPAASRGQIHVKVIQARALNVRSSLALPYVVVQFEQSEFISRDPIAESDKEVKGTATNLSRNASSVALSALGAIGSKDSALRARQSGASPSSSIASSKLSSIPPTTATTSLPSLFGRLSAHNPVWKHEVSLCVFTCHFLHLSSNRSLPQRRHLRVVTRYLHRL